ncbi:hypothetical protein DFH29DRAFT_961543 [Suillus ampliporus]|nr:hypothetical protein DFH29DRAFT_961543 [Suillus ampliporus]
MVDATLDISVHSSGTFHHQLINAFGMNSSTINFDARVVIGPIQIGGLLNAVLFGCLASTVFAVILIQLGHFVCVILTLWTMTVSTYGNPLSVLPLALGVAIPLTGSTVFIVQSFYAFQLWKLTRNVFLPILCEMISLVAQISTLIITAGAVSMMNLQTFGKRELLAVELSFIARAVCDLITTASIAWFLKKKRDTGIKETMSMIDRLIYWTIETGLLTSSMAVTLATWFLVQQQHSFMWTGVWLLWPNVVGNSFLASLNRRLLLRDSATRGGAQSGGIGMNSIMFNAEATQSQADPLESSFTRSSMLNQSGTKAGFETWSGPYASMHLTDDESRC